MNEWSDSITGTDQERASVSFLFTGKPKEYFRIWVVNTFLSIITLGIYSAWAKVRKKRYFYGNTLLYGTPFEYHAEPLKILKGRLIVAGLFIVYIVLAGLSPLMTLILWPVIVLVMPWLIARALAFRARNTSYRNVRFDFNGTYKEAFKVFVLLGLLVPLTLGLFYPGHQFRIKRFVMNKSAFGTTPFEFAGRAGAFYNIYGLAVVMFIAVIAMGGATAGLMMKALGGNFDADTAKVGLVPLFFFLLSGLIYVYTRTAITNLVWSNTTLSSHRFRIGLSIPKMLWLYVSNAAAIVFSLGALIPWASIRMAKYRIESMELMPSGSLDDFLSVKQAKVGAAGEEVGEFFDIDLGI